MIVFPIRPIMPVAKVVRSTDPAKTEESEAEQQTAGSLPVKGRSGRREGKSFYKSPHERSSAGVRDALLDLKRND